MSYASHLPTELQHRIDAMGEAGHRWVAGLDRQVAELSERWQCTPGNILTGGSESLVLSAALADGTPAVLKIGLPGSMSAEREARAYQIADGRGYARALGSDNTANALLVEALGATLDSSDLSVDEQIRVLCGALQASWVPVTDTKGLMTGIEKLEWLKDFINRLWPEHGQPFDSSVQEQAIAFIEARQHSGELTVLVHGDAHAANALLDAEGAYRLVDPDGMAAEPAADLAVLMREWDEALERDPAQACRARCALLAELTGVDLNAIWQWGFIERVSTGLHLIELDWPDEGNRMLRIAEAITGADAP